MDDEVHMRSSAKAEKNTSGRRRPRVRRRCLRSLISKVQSPTANDHRPLTCLNTTYKAITSVVNERR